MILLRIFIGFAVTVLMATTHPLFAMFGLSDDIFVMTALSCGALLIWVMLDMLEPTLKRSDHVEL